MELTEEERRILQVVSVGIMSAEGSEKDEILQKLEEGNREKIKKEIMKYFQ